MAWPSPPRLCWGDGQGQGEVGTTRVPLISHCLCLSPPAAPTHRRRSTWTSCGLRKQRGCSVWT